MVSKNKRNQKKELTKVEKGVNPDISSYLDKLQNSIQKTQEENGDELLLDKDQDISEAAPLSDEDINANETEIRASVDQNLEEPQSLVESQVVNTDVPVAAFTPEQEIDHLILENKQHNERMAEIKIALDYKNKNLGDLETRIEFLKTAHENLSDWFQDKSNSFASGFLTRLSEAKKRLEDDEIEIRNWLSTGIELDVEFVKRARNWFVKRYLSSLIIAIFLTGAVYLVSVYYPLQVAAVLYMVSMSLFNIYFFIWIIYISYLSALIQSYSRKWSKHRRDLSIASSRAMSMLASLDHVRQARLRIDSLHPQMEQYLQILSAAIHSPWKVPDELLNFKSAETQTNFLPEGVDIAAPSLGIKNSKFNFLVNQTVSKLFTIGWRREAFDNLLAAVSENAGVSVSLGEMDRDARRNGLRSLFLKLHNESFSGHNEILHDAARERIKLVVPIVQREILTQFQPLVSSVKVDPLQGLEIGEDLVQAPEDSHKWDTFLTNISGPSSPWSPLVFSDKGRTRGRQSKFSRSFILGSPRLSDRASGNEVEFIETTSQTTRPVDLLLRVDLSDWCSAGEVKVFEGMEISEIENRLDEEQYNNVPNPDLGAV